MLQHTRRFLVSMGAWRLALYLGLPLAMVFPVIAGSSHETDVGPASGLALGALWGLARRWGIYSLASRTRNYPEVLPEVTLSREDYCLLLRPFGSDGTILLADLPTRMHRKLKTRVPAPGLKRFSRVKATTTLEQLIARTAHRVLGVRTYAVVDQNLRLAPPGPVYLRAPDLDDEWHLPVRQLIRGAHTVVIVLPPGEELRTSLHWELGEIASAGAHFRVVILLPPPGRRGAARMRARHQTATMLAGLHGQHGVDGVDTRIDPRRVNEYLDQLPESVLAARVTADGDIRTWSVSEEQKFSAYADTYTEILEDALNAIDQAGLSRRIRPLRGQAASAKLSWRRTLISPPMLLALPFLAAIVAMFVRPT